MADVTYADQTQLLADYLPEVTAANEIAAVGRILASVTDQIDKYCDRPHQYFAPAAEAASDRIFRGANKVFLQLPVHVGEVASVNALELGQTVPDTAWAERNGWLYRTLTYDNRPFRIWRRDTEYTISARWGFEATPQDIAEACRQLVVHYFERMRGTIGQVTPTGFVIERDMPPSVKTILDRYVTKEYEVT